MTGENSIKAVVLLLVYEFNDKSIVHTIAGFGNLHMYFAWQFPACLGLQYYMYLHGQWYLGFMAFAAKWGNYIPMLARQLNRLIMQLWRCGFLVSCCLLMIWMRMHVGFSFTSFCVDIVGLCSVSFLDFKMVADDLWQKAYVPVF
jgi:hypothetical protein